jgi:serine/threonine protein kinase
MNEQDSIPSADLEILAQFVAELEGAPDAPAILGRFCTLHPRLADRLREQAAMIDTLIRSQPAGEADWPKSLGEFQIIRRVPGGGMGEVYEAIQTSLQRRVAVKTIRRDRISHPTQARFLREQTVLASLHQTHIVSIHTAGAEGSLVYFAMPFIAGATVGQLINLVRAFHTAGQSGKTPSLAEMAARASTVRDQAKTSTLVWPKKDDQAIPSSQDAGPLRLSERYFRSVAQVMLDAAEALQHAHNLGILHRDIKPSNLMVDTSGQCWIIDFGLAAHAGREEAPEPVPAVLPQGMETITGEAILGTPHYMAPEQWDSADVDARADIWGLGATLYELITLRRPFSGKSRGELQSMIRSQPPVPPRKAIGNVPRDLAAVCAKALHKDPAQRYASAQAFADDLRRWLHREPTSARRHVLRRVHLWSARNKGWAAGRRRSYWRWRRWWGSQPRRKSTPALRWRSCSSSCNGNLSVRIGRTRASVGEIKRCNWWPRQSDSAPNGICATIPRPRLSGLTAACASSLTPLMRRVQRSRLMGIASWPAETAGRTNGRVPGFST